MSTADIVEQDLSEVGDRLFAPAGRGASRLQSSRICIHRRRRRPRLPQTCDRPDPRAYRLQRQAAGPATGRRARRGRGRSGDGERQRAGEWAHGGGVESQPDHLCHSFEESLAWRQRLAALGPPHIRTSKVAVVDHPHIEIIIVVHNERIVGLGRDSKQLPKENPTQRRRRANTSPVRVAGCRAAKIPIRRRPTAHRGAPEFTGSGRPRP